MLDIARSEIDIICKCRHQLNLSNFFGGEGGGLENLVSAKCFSHTDKQNFPVEKQFIIKRLMVLEDSFSESSPPPPSKAK